MLNVDFDTLFQYLNTIESVAVFYRIPTLGSATDEVPY